MSEIAIFVVHKTKPGKREQVRDVLLKHMAPAAQENSVQLAYVYTLDAQAAHRVCPFQR